MLPEYTTDYFVAQVERISAKYLITSRKSLLMRMQALHIDTPRPVLSTALNCSNIKFTD